MQDTILSLCVWAVHFLHFPINFPGSHEAHNCQQGFSCSPCFHHSHQCMHSQSIVVSYDNNSHTSLIVTKPHYLTDVLSKHLNILLSFPTSVFSCLSVIVISIWTLVLQVSKQFMLNSWGCLHKEFVSCIHINMSDNLNNKTLEYLLMFYQVKKSPKPPDCQAYKQGMNLITLVVPSSSYGVRGTKLLA